eukprot:gnl/TRDRNA2_/TRDRNA2_179852_c0_seq1.p1 gnl/TRDRNA2_/TRDRNA2_179852_c0~~gnl/TRDRNA2_/TRDRNA2_179852_c0_seq1.p1  ORF type:complete len:533 (-),score=190.69 gnl/TRDRNA2_/TRDRNA2_179852_c0_seq1:82-1680(-)
MMFAVAVGLLASMAAAEQPVAFLAEEANTGVSAGAVKIMGELDVAEREIAHEMRKSPHMMRQEEALLQKASEMAFRAGKAQASQHMAQNRLQQTESALHFHHMSHKKAEHHAAHAAKHHAAVSSGSRLAERAKSAKQLIGFATEEANLAKGGIQTIGSLKHAENAAEQVLNNLGNNQAALEVQKLLNGAMKDEQQIVRAEASDAHKEGELALSTVHGIKAAAKKSPQQPKKMTLAQQATSQRALAEAQATRMTRVAMRDSHLVDDSRHVLGEMQHAEDVISKTLGSQNSEVAADVEKLMEQAQHYHKQALGAEKAEARQAWKAASEAETAAKRAPVHVAKPALAQKQAHATTSMASLESFSKSEAALARGGRKVMGEMKHLQNKVEEALGSKDAQTADEVEHLLEEAEHMQGKIVRSEVAESRLAGHKQPAFTQSAARQGTSMSSMFKRREHTLHKLFNKHQAMSREGHRIQGEVGQAEAAVEAQLRGTPWGAEAARLLHGAEKAARHMAVDEHREASLVKREAKELAKELR